MPIYLIRPKLGYSNTYLYANITIFMQFGKCRHLNPQSFSHEQVAQTIWQSDRWLTNNMFMFRFDKSFFRNATYLVSLNLLIHNVIKVINQSLTWIESSEELIFRSSEHQRLKKPLPTSTSTSFFFFCKKFCIPLYFEGIRKFVPALPGKSLRSQ